MANFVIKTKKTVSQPFIFTFKNFIVVKQFPILQLGVQL